MTAVNLTSASVGNVASNAPSSIKSNMAHKEKPEAAQVSSNTSAQKPSYKVDLSEMSRRLSSGDQLEGGKESEGMDMQKMVQQMQQMAKVQKAKQIASSIAGVSK